MKPQNPKKSEYCSHRTLYSPVKSPLYTQLKKRDAKLKEKQDYQQLRIQLTGESMQLT